MSSPDFLDRLRSAEGPDAPPASVVRSRARQIQRRRYVALSSGAVVVALIAGVGLFVRGPSSPPRNQNANTLSEAASAPTPTAASGAASVSGGRAGASKSSGGPLAPAAATAGSSTVAQSGGYAASDRSAPQRTMTATVSAKKRAVGRGDDFALKVCNGTGVTQTRSFPTVQRYDFEVRRGDTTVWRWSHDTSFAQQTGTLQWRPGECKSFSETWDGMDDSGKPVAPGSYSVTAWLASQPERSKPLTFCLDVC